MTRSHRQRMAVGVLAAGLGLGLGVVPASAVSASPLTLSAHEGGGAFVSKGKRTAKGSAMLRVSAAATATTGAPFTLTSAQVSGVVRRHRRVIKRVTIPMRPRGSSGDSWRGRTTLRSLAPGRYRVRLTHLTTSTTVPGGRIPSRRLSGQVTSVKVRPQRTTFWRAEYSVATVNHMVVSGEVVDATGHPVGGLAVCAEDQGRFWFTERCEATNHNGRFGLRLQPLSEHLLAGQWEYLRVGDPRLDLAWRTRRWQVSDLPARMVVSHRGAVTGVVSGESGVGLAGQSICAVPRDFSPYHEGGVWLMDQRWCTTTDGSGSYSLRVDGEGQTRVWVPGDPTSKGFVDLMDSVVAADDGSEVFRWDVGRSPNARPGDAPGWQWADLLNMAAVPGRQFDLTLTDLVSGDAIQVTGRVTHTLAPDTALVGQLVCGFSRAGYQCTQTDESGHYRLSLPIRVDPDSPDAPVAGKIVAGPRGGQWGDDPAWARFDAVPGASVTADLVLAP